MERKDNDPTGHGVRIRRLLILQGSTRMSLRFQSKPIVTCLYAVFVCACFFSDGAVGQNGPVNPLHYHVRNSSQRLEMLVNSSRILTMDVDIPRAQVNNPGVVRLTPLAANQIQVSALSPGVTQVNVFDEHQNIYTVDLMVVGDVRELDMILKSTFPDATLRVRPMNTSVLIEGEIPRPELTSRVIAIAEDYYPKVISNMTVRGVQTVLLHVKVMEVSRTKLRKLGIDWNYAWDDGFFVQGASGLLNIPTSTAGLAAGGSDTLRFGVMNGANTFTGLIEALRQNNLVKVLSEPTLVTMSGRPASFLVGGEFPILVPAGIANATIEFKEFGTRVDFVPIVLGDGRLRLEVRPVVSEIDESRSVTVNSFTVPGLRTRRVDTGVEMEAGQTLALAGLLQERTEIENKGVPWIADVPYLGAAFRRVQEEVNEIELLIMVTPEIVDAMDSDQVPPCGPGQRTTSPSDCELYGKGYLEVPKCCHDGSCVSCQGSPSVPAEAPLIEQQTQLPYDHVAPIVNVPIQPALPSNVPSQQEPTPPAEPSLDPLASLPPAVSGDNTLAATGPPATPNPQTQHKATPPTRSRVVRQSTFTPTLIGPVGYELHE